MYNSIVFFLCLVKEWSKYARHIDTERVCRTAETTSLKGFDVMSGLAGFSDYSENLTEEKYLWIALVRRMLRRIAHRGQLGRELRVSRHCALACACREHGTASDFCGGGFRDDSRAFAALDGSLTNGEELRSQLKGRGYPFRDGSDAETVLAAYLCWGEDCAAHLEGSFAFVVDDVPRRKTCFFRDRLGLKPLFYCFQGGRMAFASEIKSLFEFPGVNPVIGTSGLGELFGLGPGRTPGCGVFEGIQELPPGHRAVYSEESFSLHRYAGLGAQPFTDSYETAMEKVAGWLTETARCQQPSGNTCILLNGCPGQLLPESAAIAAMLPEDSHKRLAACFLRHEAMPLWEPEADLLRLFPCGIFTPDCSSGRLADSLFEGVIARDLPGLADLDGGLLHFCRTASTSFSCALTGVPLSDFYAPGSFCAESFPWMSTPDGLTLLLRPELRAAAADYISARYEEALAEVPVLRGESALRRRRREVAYVSLSRLLPAFLERLDRMGAIGGLELRSPYLDWRLMEYLFQLPPELLAPSNDSDGKNVLREAQRILLSGCGQTLPLQTGGELPEGLRSTLWQRLGYILRDSLQPIHKLLDPCAEARLSALAEETDAGSRQWASRLPAYLIQLNYWMLHYNVYLEF